MLTVRVSEKELNQLTKFSSNREQPRGVIVRELIKNATNGI